MPLQTTYTDARAHFAELCNRVIDDRETVIIKRRGSRDVAMVAADELSSLLETAHLLRLPKNASRLLTALHSALTRTEQPQTLRELRRDVGLGEK